VERSVESARSASLLIVAGSRRCSAGPEQRRPEKVSSGGFLRNRLRLPSRDSIHNVDPSSTVKRVWIPTKNQGTSIDLEPSTLLQFKERAEAGGARVHFHTVQSSPLTARSDACLRQFRSTLLLGPASLFQRARSANRRRPIASGRNPAMGFLLVVCTSCLLASHAHPARRTLLGWIAPTGGCEYVRLLLSPR